MPPAARVAPFVQCPGAMRIPLLALAPLLDSPHVWELACRTPWLFDGASLHRAGLHALESGRWDDAAELFEQAGHRYREELETERLARVRVHQLMARALAGGGSLSPLSLEVDRALTRLEWIEAPTAPFDLVPALSLLASWLDAERGPDGLAGAGTERLAA